jgi:3-oxoacyl-[acyl-carrier-protein] synthase-3
VSDVKAGVVATAHYLPPHVMSSGEIAEAAGLPLWVVEEKLRIKQKHVAAPDTHPNAMAAIAGRRCIEKAGIDPAEIDVLLCTTEEWKEYCLWTAGIDLAYEIGAVNATRLHEALVGRTLAVAVAADLGAVDPHGGVVVHGLDDQLRLAAQVPRLVRGRVGGRGVQPLLLQRQLHQQWFWETSSS